jgi:poly(A) polymerase
MGAVKLSDPPWRSRAGLNRLLTALGAEQGLIRIVGGAVRDALIGVGAKDIDCATRLRPEEVRDRITAAGFKAVPTGIAHGTITAVLPGGPVEVTTLRRDVSTDGRHAVVAFTDEWREDAARRDFTINALSADPTSGEVHDYFGGVDDLAAGLVRFIGDPLTRIAEDHLRILRFFRFQGRFGRAEPDGAALAACIARANDLMALSRERIADEMLRILAAPAPSGVLAIMLRAGILLSVLPEISAVERLTELERRERVAGVAPDPLRRFAAMFPQRPDIAVEIGARFKLSNRARRRLADAADGSDPQTDPRALAYRFGVDGALDRLLLSPLLSDAQAAAAVTVVHAWQRPTLPIGGGDLIALGLKPGPVIAATLQAVERQWIAEGFPDAARVRAIAAQAVAAA